jgi:hypothetical protein
MIANIEAVGSRIDQNLTGRSKEAADAASEMASSVSSAAAIESSAQAARGMGWAHYRASWRYTPGWKLGNDTGGDQIRSA